MKRIEWNAFGGSDLLVPETDIDQAKLIEKLYYAHVTDEVAFIREGQMVTLQSLPETPTWTQQVLSSPC